ncbi:MAG: hypothetical protein HZA83_02785, partial [Thaumarchaeota archaeon]|nr:hypothetical protein [Nitrososphaerota archaeon]
MKKFYLLTIIAAGLFIGFWLGFFVFAQVHIKVVCKPSGKILLDTTRSLRNEFTLSTSVKGCDSIDLIIDKPRITKIPETLTQNEPPNMSQPAATPFGGVSIPPPPQAQDQHRPISGFTQTYNFTKVVTL